MGAASLPAGYLSFTHGAVQSLNAPLHRPLYGGKGLAAAVRAALDGTVGQVHGQVVDAGAVGGVPPARQPAEAAPAGHKQWAPRP